MSDATERIVNLALFLASSREPATADDCRSAVEGYPSDQDDIAFQRMFERDKDALRTYGLVIEVVEGDSYESYRLDRDATFASAVQLDPDALTALRAAAGALAIDPAFPHRTALSLAMLKLGELEGDPAVADACLADETPDTQGICVASLADAVEQRKAVHFEYSDAADRNTSRSVEPYGLLLRAGRWYVVGRDAVKDAIRMFAVPRVSALQVNTTRPKSHDFVRPESFDMATYVRLPFQFGTEDVSAEILFDKGSAWRAKRLAQGEGSLEPQGSGAILWRVHAHDSDRLLQWCVEHGPGVTIAGPPGLLLRLKQAMAEVVSAHGDAY